MRISAALLRPKTLHKKEKEIGAPPACQICFNEHVFPCDKAISDGNRTTQNSSANNGRAELIIIRDSGTRTLYHPLFNYVWLLLQMYMCGQR